MALPGVVAGQSLPSVADYPQTATLTPAEGWPGSVGTGGRLASESVATFRRNHRPLCVGTRSWLALGLFDRMMRDLARLRRRAAGRRPQPRLAIIDTQTVKCLPVRGPRGYDAAKRVVGRKRVALVDADGTWLAVAVVPACVQERDTLLALEDGKTAWPSLRVAIFDGAFTAERCREWSNLHGMRHEVVTRPPGQKGFEVLPRRWVVERSFGWLTHRGCLLRDRAGRLDVAATRIACTAVLAATEALINPA